MLLRVLRGGGAFSPMQRPGLLQPPCMPVSTGMGSQLQAGMLRRPASLFCSRGMLLAPARSAWRSSSALVGASRMDSLVARMSFVRRAFNTTHRHPPIPPPSKEQEVNEHGQFC
jgi:hypothetical protein